MFSGWTPIQNTRKGPKLVFIGNIWRPLLSQVTRWCVVTVGNVNGNPARRKMWRMRKNSMKSLEWSQLRGLIMQTVFILQTVVDRSTREGGIKVRPRKNMFTFAHLCPKHLTNKQGGFFFCCCYAQNSINFIIFWSEKKLNVLKFGLRGRIIFIDLFVGPTQKQNSFRR